MPNPTAQTMELTLEEAWAEDLIRRHPRIDRMLVPDELAALAEDSWAPPRFELLGPVLDCVREVELAQSTQQIKASDEARLLEAVVYRLGRYLFSFSAHVALEAHDLMLPCVRGDEQESNESERNPIGFGYSARLDAVKKADYDNDSQGVWRSDIADKLDEINRKEATQEYADVARRGRLLCYCAALWILELKRTTDAEAVALNESFRTSLSGDVIALFFRARALLASPTMSDVHAQMALQFVTTALDTYGRNPGMHHTKAILLLRQSGLTEDEAESRACLEQALGNVEAALRADAEAAGFYATRAKVKHRLGDRSGALIDIRAAIDLARYKAGSPAVRSAMADWEGTLESWWLTPLGPRSVESTVATSDGTTAGESPTISTRLARAARKTWQALWNRPSAS